MRESVENPWVRYSFKNGRTNKRGGGQGLEVFIAPLARVAVFLRSVENLSDVRTVLDLQRANARSLKSMEKKKIQGPPRTPKRF